MARRTARKVKSAGLPDLPLLFIIFTLLIFGIIMVYDATVVYSYNVFGGKYHFLLLQSGWVTIGLAVAAVASYIDYHIYPRFALPLMLFSMFLLVLVFVPGLGVEIYGANRWISFGSLTLQPSEIAKLGLVVYLSSWLAAGKVSKRKLSAHKKHQFSSFAVLIGVLMLLILAQPNFSTALILSGIGVAIYFVSGSPLRHFIILVGALVVIGSFFILSSPYRTERLKTYLDPSTANVLDEGYHITQIKIALGSGGFLGKGLGQSRQKYDYLPEVCSDSIFAIIGEELGFLGTSILTVAFLTLFLRSLTVAVRAPDELGMLLAVGVTSWFALQVFVNLSAMVGLIPLTGVTIPFISCGGSAAIVNLAGTGILLNVSRQTK